MRTLITLIIGLSLALGTSFADTVTLRDLPENNAKAVGTVDLANGVVPIYSPKDSEWIKIADPSNGNVGWVKQSEFKSANAASIQVTQQTKGPDGKVQSNGYQLNVGKPFDLNDPKVKANLDEMNKMQLKVQQNMKTQIQDMVKGINDLYQKQLQLLEQSGFYVPGPKAAAPVNNATAVPNKTNP